HAPGRIEGTRRRTREHAEVITEPLAGLAAELAAVALLIALLDPVAARRQRRAPAGVDALAVGRAHQVAAAVAEREAALVIKIGAVTGLGLGHDPVAAAITAPGEQLTLRRTHQLARREPLGHAGAADQRLAVARLARVDVAVAAHPRRLARVAGDRRLGGRRRAARRRR